MRKFFSTLILACVAVMPAHAADKPRVLMETSLGNFTLELNPAAAPITVENFIKYVEDGHYNGTIFHRVIDGFMVQGGGYTEDYSQKKTRAEIQNEADNGLKNKRGSIAMARTSMPHSATAQFFINTAYNTSLDHTAKSPRGWGYAVFGEVVEGMDTIDKISGTPTGAGGPFRTDAPKTKVVIKNASVVK